MITLLLGMVWMKFAAVLIGSLGVGLVGTFQAIQGMMSTMAGPGIQSSQCVMWRRPPDQREAAQFMVAEHRFSKTRDQSVIDVLNAYVCESLRQVREISRVWIIKYNEKRPHDSFGKIPPAMFRRQVENARNSTSELCH